jgi:1,2-diacylglycerol 3-alpha-glucosyltransferase
MDQGSRGLRSVLRGAGPSRLLSVACVVPLPPYPAGSAVLCADVLAGLARRGHRVRAVAPITDAARRGDEDVMLECSPVSVTRFTVPYFEMFRFTGADETTAVYRAGERAGVREGLRSLIEAERPDVVLIGREIYGWYVNDIVAAASLPSVLLSHGGPTTAIRSGAWPATEAAALLDGMAAADVVVSVAEHWRTALHELGLRRVVHIPNPVDLDRFAPGPREPQLVRKLDVLADDVVVVHASNLSLVKRVRDLIAAAELALRHDPRLLFIVAGEGPERVHAERLCRERGLTRRFRFVGWVDHAAMPDYFRLADIVVVPSEHETQSLVYLEAMASGCCLVASDVPGAREIVRHEKTGFLFPMGDVTSLARVLLVAGDEGRRNAIGLAARLDVVSHALPRVTAAYEDLLRAVASGRSGYCEPSTE